MSHYYERTLVFLPVCTVATALKAMCKCCGRVFGRDSNGSKDHCILNLGLDGDGQLHASAALPPSQEAPGIHWIRGWVGPTKGQDVVDKRPCRASNSRS
jgi:hypothetical protein